MDSDEFPVPSFREREAISHYLKIEHEFMPPRVFYTLTCNAQYRSDAVSRIVRVSKIRDAIPFFRLAVVGILNAHE